MVSTTLITGTSINLIMDNVAYRELVALGDGVRCAQLPSTTNARADTALRTLAQAANSKTLRYPSANRPFVHTMKPGSAQLELDTLLLHLRSNCMADRFTLRRGSTVELGGLCYLALIFQAAQAKGFKVDDRLKKILRPWVIVAIADVSFP